MNMTVTQNSPAALGGSFAQLAGARSVHDLLTAIINHPGGFDSTRINKIALLGSASEGQRLAGICRTRGIEIAALVDDDPTRLGAIVQGVRVEPSSGLARLDRAMPIIIASHRV